MASPNGLVFAGFDVDAHPGYILFKGPFGTVYPLSVGAAAADFNAPHGQWSKFHRGSRDGQTAIITGVHDKVLYAFIVEEGVAMPLKGASNSTELAEVYDLVKAPQSVAASVIAPGPLGNDYTFDVSCLHDKYGLRKDEKFSINGSTNVYAVGELFGCLWVKHGLGNQPAIPLPGATSEKALHELYQAGEPAEQPGISTPRKTAVTTPRAGLKPPFVLDAKSQSAICQAAFGNTITVETSRKALVQWGVTHGQKFLGTIGPAREKQVTIVGSHLGALFIHIEGDRKVTCCRNCENGDELAEVYGFGSGGVKRELPMDEVTPVRARPTTRAESAKKGPTTSVGDTGSPPADLSRPTHKKKLFTMWTSFGRQSFDVSPSATTPFGYAHGMTVKATRGLDKDTIFHIVGENGGILWVVQDGKPRAVALRHCENKEDIQQRFGFVVQPGKKDLTNLSQLESEPAHTPIQTPRGSIMGSPRGNTGEYTPRSTVETPRGATVSYATAPTTGSSPAPPSSSVPLGIPTLNFNALSPQNLSNPPQQQQSERSLPFAPTAPPTMPQTSSSHRNYLKAVALLKTGAHSVEEDKLRFHKYYMTNTTERLGHAMGKLNTFRDAFNTAIGNGEAFEKASCNEMLTTMRRRAEIFA